MNPVPKITVMIMVEDTARADIAFTHERTYYRFASDFSVEDGQLKAVEGYDSIMARLIDAAMPLDNEKPLPPDVKVHFFVDNRISPEKPTEQSLKRIINILTSLFPEFSFIEGFTI